MSASGTASKPSTKFFGFEDYVDLMLEAADSEADGQPVRFGCHKLEVAKAYKGFGDFLCKQELKVDVDGVKFVQITNVDAKTLDKILRHIYKVDIEEKELDAKLLEAAKHYKLDALFKICLAATIPKELTNQNVLEAFKIAYQLDLKDEKNSTFQFIWENLEEIVATSEFKELMITYPCLVMDFIVKSKGHHTPAEMEKKVIPFTSKGNEETLKGDPILIGTVKCKPRIQEFTLPDDLPMEAKGVRIIPVESFNSGCSCPVDAFVKLWSCYKDGDCQHFIFRSMGSSGRHATPELCFSVDAKNRKIFADATRSFYGYSPDKPGYELAYILHLYLVGYIL